MGEALREALLNACINKDYAEPSPIQIRVYENKLEIINGGVLPEGWTVETLLSSHRSMPYNPDIANTFFRAGEIEAWGRGIERIITACKNDGFSTPDFRYDASGIWTTFKFEYPESGTGRNGYGYSKSFGFGFIWRYTRRQAEDYRRCDNVPFARRCGKAY